MSDEPTYPARANPYATGGAIPTSPAGPVFPTAGAVPYDQLGDSTGGLIPYKNPKALIAYYLGIAALLPIIGFPFGIASLVLGVMGLKARARNPVIKGSVHAWIGIVLGAGSIVIYGGLLAVMVVGIVGAMG